MTLHRDPTISGADFRLAMRRLAAGVSIISGAGPDGPLGVTATAVTSLTAEPPSVLCCLNRSLDLEAAVKETGRFAVNMLSADHQDLAKRFAGMHGPLFELRRTTHPTGRFCPTTSQRSPTVWSASIAASATSSRSGRIRSLSA